MSPAASKYLCTTLKTETCSFRFVLVMIARALRLLLFAIFACVAQTVTLSTSPYSPISNAITLSPATSAISPLSTNPFSPKVSKQVSGSISWASAEYFGAAVVEFISAQEKEVVEGVQRNFQQVSLSARSIAPLCADRALQAEESFKGLRRKLPKTKQEFNWQVLARV